MTCKEVAICLTKDHPDLAELDEKIKALRADFNKQIEQLQKEADSRKKFFDKQHEHLGDKVVALLKEKGLYPEEYNKRNQHQRISFKKSGVLVFEDHTDCNNHPLAGLIKALTED